VRTASNPRAAWNQGLENLQMLLRGPQAQTRISPKRGSMADDSGEKRVQSLNSQVAGHNDDRA
jgi:hypothetical protein